MSPSKKNKPIVRTEDWIAGVYAMVRKIPKGKVSNYGTIAETAGTRLTSRMIGWAMNKSGSVKPKVPAHRVVNRNGILTGKHHFATPTLMQELLEAEGIQIVDDKIVDFEKHFWKPNEK